MKVLITIALTWAIYPPLVPWVGGAWVAYYVIDWITIALKTRGWL